MRTDGYADGLDDRAWARLRVLVIAASAGNRAAFEGEVRTWSAEASLGEQHRIGPYLLAVVKYLIRRSLMGEPAEGDLRRIAARCLPGVSRVLTAHPMAVEDTLRAAFGLPAVRRKLSPGEHVVLSAAITGSMLAEPADEMPELRAYVAEWWRVNARSFHEHGVEDG